MGKIDSGVAHVQEGTRTVNRRLDLRAGADDSRIPQQFRDLAVTKRSDLDRIKMPESGPESLALAKDGNPRKTSLESFQHQHFPKGSAVKVRKAPLPVVIFTHQRVAFGPRATQFHRTSNFSLRKARDENPTISRQRGTAQGGRRGKTGEFPAAGGGVTSQRKDGKAREAGAVLNASGSFSIAVEVLRRGCRFAG